MLVKLRALNLSDKVVCSLIGGGKPVEGVEDNSYDVVTLAGGFAVGHLPVDAFDEVVRVLKPGEFDKARRLPVLPI